MRRLKRWTKEEDQIIKEKYEEFGSGIQKLLPDRAKHSIVCRACDLKVRYEHKLRPKTFCIDCGKETNYFSSLRNKSFPAYWKRCRSCSAKVKYNKREKSWRFGKLFSEEDIKLIIELYPKVSNVEIAKRMNRSKSSIIHKANRLGLVKPIEFQREHGRNIMNMFNEKINSKESHKKAKETWRKNYILGNVKLTGIALKSKNGLTKKENHPNWLGGISFEPYDSRFDKNFKIDILKRDGCCMLCNKTINELRLYKTQICIHHIDYNKLNSVKENCITLCNSCHCQTNYRRNRWKRVFQSILSNKYNYNYNQILCTQ